VETVIAFAESLCVECGVAVEAELAMTEFGEDVPTVKRQPTKTGKHKRRATSTSPGKRRG
jgi:hypothetical protein